jgi:hypothetical protein
MRVILRGQFTTGRFALTDLIVKVADFTTVPGARYVTDGDGSADEFFEKYLAPVLESQERVSEDYLLTVDFDGTWGYPPSFVSQLAKRLLGWYKTPERVEEYVSIKSDEQPGQKQEFWDEVAKIYDSQDFES